MSSDAEVPLGCAPPGPGCQRAAGGRGAPITLSRWPGRLTTGSRRAISSLAGRRVLLHGSGRVESVQIDDSGALGRDAPDRPLIAAPRSS